MATTTGSHHGTSARGLLGFRRQPGRLALLVFRTPLPLYRAGLGWLFLGRTFLVLTHVGRKTGKPHATAAMVLAEDGPSGEAVICSVWGPRADWIRNLHANPALRVQIGRESFVPHHRFLSGEEAFTVGVGFRRHHPWRVRMIGRVLGVDLRSDTEMREFISARPFVALRPAEPAEGAQPGRQRRLRHTRGTLGNEKGRR
jgi:deazaflavin-dependent oxidoreductase (nitroreductase family)